MENNVPVTSSGQQGKYTYPLLGVAELFLFAKPGAKTVGLRCLCRDCPLLLPDEQAGQVV